MAFMDFFKNVKTDNTGINDLHNELKEKFPNKDDNFLGKIACISGLLAKVAHCDLEVSKEEEKSMHIHLQEYGEFNNEEALIVVDLAILKMEKLKGLHTRDYCAPLTELLDKTQRYEVLKLLFSVAASDENVDNDEVETIRTICTGLLLEHKHFVAAKAGIKEHLGALKS